MSLDTPILGLGKSDISISDAEFCVKMARANVERVMLSIPHDGAGRYEFDGVFVPRKKGVTVRDMNVWPIGRDVFSKTSSVGLIRGTLPRTLVDYNRAIDGRDYTFYPSTKPSIEPAYEDETFSGPYAMYHRTVSESIKSAIDKHGKKAILLIDLHGFSNQPEYASKTGYDCILGTGNRRSIKHGNVDIEFAEFLTGRGYDVFLPKSQPVRKDIEDDFDAGHITRHYADIHDINTLQVEIASRLRDPKNPADSKQFASDIADFINKNYR